MKRGEFIPFEVLWEPAVLIGLVLGFVILGGLGGR